MDIRTQFLNTARRILSSYKDKCDCMEIRLEQSSRVFIQFHGHDLTSLSQKNEYGANVRAYYRGGWGFASFNDLDQLAQYADEAYRQAVLISSVRSEDYIPLAKVEGIEKVFPYSVKTDPARLSINDKLKQVRRYNERILGYDPKITSSRATYFDQVTQKDLLTTDNVFVSIESLDLGGALIAIGSDHSLTQEYAVGFGSSNDYGVFLELDQKVEDTCSTVVNLLRASKPKAGTYPVICDPSLGGVFVHEAFGHLSESDSMVENKQLRDIMQIGKQFGSEKLNIYDSGLVEGSRGYVPVDDEGVPGQKQYLIKNGVLCGRLHTRETAAKMGEPLSGNARSISYRYPPICRMRDTVIECGTDSFNDMIKDIECGVYAVNSKGGQTNGEMFTFTAAKGYMIRNGQLAELVRDVTLSGNLFTTLANIDAVGNDQTLHDSGGGCGKGDQFPLPVSHESPHIRIKNLVVGGE